MTIDQLVAYLQEGREIEFSLENRSYFLSGDWGSVESQGDYYIYDNIRQAFVVSGDVQTILSYEFCPGVSLEKRMESFVFAYVL